jgi:T3SS negative regulator,GrlR
MAVEGFWTAEFGSSVGIFGGGVAFLQDGKVLGGDNAYFYVGGYELHELAFKATIEINPFIQGVASVFNTVGQKFTLDLVGSLESQDRIVAQGQRRGMPGVTFGVKLTKRA